MAACCHYPLSISNSPVNARSTANQLHPDRLNCTERTRDTTTPRRRPATSEGCIIQVMDTSKALGGVQSRLFKRIAVTVFAFTLSAGIMFALFTYAPEKHLQRLSNAVGIPFKARPIPECGGFVGSNEIWEESQSKYQHLRDDKFTYVPTPTAPYRFVAPTFADCISLVSPCKHIDDPRN